MSIALKFMKTQGKFDEHVRGDRLVGRLLMTIVTAK